MTDNQRTALLLDWWPAACKVQNWPRNDREFRLRVLSLAVTYIFTSVQEFRDALDNYETLRQMPPSEHRPKFRHLKSATELNNRGDIDAVKAMLLMCADNLKAADEVDKPSRGVARRHRDVIEDHIRCLTQYPLENPMGEAGARAYIQTLIDGKFNRQPDLQKITMDDVDDRPRFVPHKVTGRLEEKPSQMEQLLMTVSKRLNGKTGFRAKAGHSMHDMLTGVGLECHCKGCLSARVAPAFASALAQPEPVPAIPEPEDVPF